MNLYVLSKVMTYLEEAEKATLYKSAEWWAVVDAQDIVEKIGNDLAREAEAEWQAWKDKEES